MSVLVPKHLPGVTQLLFHLIGADMNVTTDQIMNAVNGMDVATPYQIESIRVNNASVSLTAADGGIYSAPAKAGDIIVAAAQVYTALTGPTLGIELPVLAVGLGRRTGAPILSLTGSQGGAATADFFVYGRIMPSRIGD